MGTSALWLDPVVQSGPASGLLGLGALYKRDQPFQLRVYAVETALVGPLQATQLLLGLRYVGLEYRDVALDVVELGLDTVEPDVLAGLPTDELADLAPQRRQVIVALQRLILAPHGQPASPPEKR